MRPTPSPLRSPAIRAVALAASLAAGTALAATKPAPLPAPAPRAEAPAQAPCERLDIAPVVTVAVGKSTVIRPGSPVARILLGNPENARAARPSDTPEPAAKDDSVKTPTQNLRPGVADIDVLLLGPTEIFLLGKTVGSTNVVMLDRSGRCTAFDVVVGMDTSGLQAVLTRLLPDEKGINVSAAFDSVVLSGQVSDAEALTRVTDLANAFVRGQSRDGGGPAKNPRIVNLLEVGAPQQVMLEVKVAEISKSLLDSFGLDFSRAYVGDRGEAMRFLSGIFGGGAGVLTNLSGTGPNNVPLSSVGTVVGGTVTGTVTAGNSSAVTQGGNVTVTYDAAGRPIYTTTYGTVPAKGVTNAALNMQKTDGLVKVLAEPTVMAISGQTGSFLAGGKILIPIIQTADGGGRTITLDEKEFGISVKFTPTVMGGGRINLKVRPEVSELNAAGVVIGSGNFSTVLPSFTSRKAETTVQLLDGQSFAIGGLIKNNTTTNVKAFPFLGEIPVLGALFRSTEFQTDKSELVFVITPRLVKPLPADYRLPTDNYVAPTRKDLILNGRIEGERPAAPPPAPATAPAAAPATTPATGGFDVPTTENKR
ncbi:type II and III secretion system protein family protein [Ideonella sp.]|uniref:type II and III secretion system protein family protein n=1 Tax=Ideonella sp. TaxID=1929293 RepID=UPI002B480C0B|nr:type II and III secretion system protein family protein [Ideonella sp.]HJV69440.1 type II and III secretion system protein family protein [Ideonella sp.]